MAPRFESITLGPDDDGRRLDRVARKVLVRIPLSRVFSAIRSGEIRLNGRRVKGDKRVAAGDTLEIRSALVSGGIEPARPPSAPPRDESAPPDESSAPLHGRIVFESDHLLVVNKLRGELVHGPGSLDEAVKEYLRDRRERGVSFVPGPVHRLDRNTTGLVIFAASLRGAQEMSLALRERRLEKVYGAVLQGCVEEMQHWTESIVRDRETMRSETGSGAAAESIVEPVAVCGNASLVAVAITTGRTHQIRVHAASAGSPLLGDRKYGGSPFPGGYILHAGSIACDTAKDDIPGFERLWTPLPEDADARLRGLFGAEAVNRLYDRFSGAE